VLPHRNASPLPLLDHVSVPFPLAGSLNQLYVLSACIVACTCKSARAGGVDSDA
jgi:hypothetical protein